jgi:glycogen synthase
MTMDGLRVLHVLDHSLPHRSGYAMRSAAILKFQRLSGCDPIVLTSPRHGETDVSPCLIDEIACHRSDATAVGNDLAPSHIPFMRETRQLQYMERRIVEVARKERVQIIHAHSPSLNGIPALRAARRLDIPVVYEVRAFWEDAAVDQRKFAEGSLKYRLSQMIETWLLHRVDHVTVICEGLRQELLHRGIPAGKISVIPNGVNPQDFNLLDASDSVIRQFGLEGNRVLGFIGSFYRYEGLQLLVRAMKVISAHRPDVRLMLVGTGEIHAEIAKDVRRLGLTKTICLPGSKPPDEVRDFYAAMDVLVYPRLPERITNIVTPLKPLEAMAMGKLVVGSDVGGIAELVRDGDTGILFEAGSHDDLVYTLLKTLNEADRWPALALRARQYVQRVRNWAEIVPKYLDVYDRAVHRHAGRRTASRRSA